MEAAALRDTNILHLPTFWPQVFPVSLVIWGWRMNRTTLCKVYFNMDMNHFILGPSGLHEISNRMWFAFYGCSLLQGSPQVCVYSAELWCRLITCLVCVYIISLSFISQILVWTVFVITEYPIWRCRRDKIKNIEKLEVPTFL